MSIHPNCFLAFLVLFSFHCIVELFIQTGEDGGGGGGKEVDKAKLFRFPLGTVKKIVKLDDDVNLASQVRTSGCGWKNRICRACASKARWLSHSWFQEMKRKPLTLGAFNSRAKGRHFSVSRSKGKGKIWRVEEVGKQAVLELEESCVNASAGSCQGRDHLLLL